MVNLPVIAYIDPGTGMVIGSSLGVVLAALAAALGVVGLFFRRIFNFIKKFKKIILIILVIIVIGGGIYFLIGSKKVENRSDFKGRIIILGIDGMSPSIIEPMMEKGELPNFKKLADTGSYTRMKTTNPSESPVAWVGFGTGQNGGKNGMFDFIKRNAKDYSLSLSTSDLQPGRARSVVKTKRFWQYASDMGIPSVILNCPITFPPDNINGRMLSGMGVPDLQFTEGTFTFYTTDPPSEKKDTGGKVVSVDNATQINTEVYGPKRQTTSGTENATVPLVINISEDSKGASFELQGQKFDLKVGEWSEWQSVTFNLGLFKKMRGIVRFQLIETTPGFKLYCSPVNFDPKAPAYQISYPGSYSTELADTVGIYYTQGMPCDTWALNEERINEDGFLNIVDNVTRKRYEMLQFEMGRFDQGILYTYFECCDAIQHMFWRYTDPEGPMYKNDPKYANTIHDWYKRMDTMLGEVMAKMKPTDTIIVMSDHGFAPFRRSVHMNSWLRKNGYLVLKDNSAKEGKELLDDVDWSKTRAYAIGFGAIYFNLKGREGKGIVSGGAETEALKKEITAGLLKWQDEEHNKPVVKGVYPKEQLFWGDEAKDAPELVVGFNYGYRASWQTALGAAPDKLLEDNMKKWAGDHLMDPSFVPAILFSNKKLAKDASILDLTPTILKMLGCKEEQQKAFDFDGKPLL